jgi:hypothetical protein
MPLREHRTRCRRCDPNRNLSVYFGQGNAAWLGPHCRRSPGSERDALTEVKGGRRGGKGRRGKLRP